jgi:hypothetical protein
MTSAGSMDSEPAPSGASTMTKTPLKNIEVGAGKPFVTHNGHDTHYT